MSRSRWSGLISSSRGQSAVEFALMMPLVFFLALGVADFGRAFFSLINLSNAAQEGARWGALRQCTTSSSTNSIQQRVTGGASDLTGISTAISYLDSAGASAGSPSVGGAVVVAASVTYTPITPIIGNLTVAALGGSITLTQSAQALVESLDTSC